MAANSRTESGARRGPHPLALSYLTLFALLIVLAAAVSFLGDPHAGDPVVVMDLHGLSPPRSTKRLRRHFPPAAALTQPGAAAQIPPAVNSPRPPEITQQVYSGSALVADPALVENTPIGPLPRIADDGTTPMRAYAPAPISDDRPRIAIVIGGLGISAKATEAALKGLPPA